MEKIANTIENFNLKIGRLFALLTIFMVVIMFLSVLQRYLFNFSFIWQQELIGFMHSIIFLGASAYTLIKDDHVRVDIFYQKMSEKNKALVNLLGCIFLIIPFSSAIFYFSYGYIINSWKLFESSAEYNGMPGVFILKSFIWVFSISLILQAISISIKSIITLRK